MQYATTATCRRRWSTILARLGWAHGDDEIFTRERVRRTGSTSPGSVAGAGAVRRRQAEVGQPGAHEAAVARTSSDGASSPYLERAGLDPAAGPPPGAVATAAARPRRDARRDGRRRALFLRDAASGAGAASPSTSTTANRAGAGRARSPTFERSPWTREAIGAALKAAAARHGLKPPQVMMPLRVLVCGTTRDAGDRRGARAARTRDDARAPRTDCARRGLAPSSPSQRRISAADRSASSPASRSRSGCGAFRVNYEFPELVAHDQVRLRDRRRRFLAGEGHRRRLPRRDPRLPRRPRHQSQARSRTSTSILER